MMAVVSCQDAWTPWLGISTGMPISRMLHALEWTPSVQSSRRQRDGRRTATARMIWVLAGCRGGNRSNGFGDFNNAGVNGYRWSSTVEGGAVWYRSLSAGITTIGRYQSLPRLGFSIRSLQDAE